MSNHYTQSTTRVVLYIYAYAFLEWLFFITKPSFLGAWTAPERVVAVLIGALPFLTVALLAHLTCALIAYPIQKGNDDQARANWLLKIVPAAIFAIIALMLVDNFSYTWFGWGSIQAKTYAVPLYWAGLATLIILHLRRQPRTSSFEYALAGFLILASVATVAWTMHEKSDPVFHAYRSDTETSQLPNIILFAADGVDARYTSAYGYERKTTPFLDTYLDRALVADNAFTNSGWTTSSLTSMLTGKYPATTKLLYPPYTLTGRDAFQHLPHILRDLGYRSLQETVRYYADGPDLNWADSFDFANGRSISRAGVNPEPLSWQLPQLFVRRLYERIAVRAKRLLYLDQTASWHDAVVTQGNAHVYGTSDQQRMHRVSRFIRETERPFFIHIHLMGTHCCDYSPADEHFSAQPTDTRKQARAAARDDTILKTDRYFGQMMALLENQSLLDNTLIVYSSDHDAGWDFRYPVPLIFWFPDGAHRGHFKATMQLLDVAPTILDYLGVALPPWMEGKSILADNFKRDRPVFSVYRLNRQSRVGRKAKRRLAQVTHMGPPDYGLDQFGMIVCQRWYIANLDSAHISSGSVDNASNDCPENKLPNNEDAERMIRTHLNQRGIRF